MAQQLEFAVGAAVILAPQYGIPVFLASALGKLVFKSRKRNAPGHIDKKCDSNGKQQVSLQWSHVSCSITSKSGEVKQLLQEQSAIAKPNRYSCVHDHFSRIWHHHSILHCMTLPRLTNRQKLLSECRLLAIMGPSGSGKTTLLNTLARQVACQKKLDLTGHILINGQPIETANVRQGYVQQEDMFFSQLTVRYAGCHVLHLIPATRRCSIPEVMQQGRICPAVLHRQCCK